MLRSNSIEVWEGIDELVCYLAAAQWQNGFTYFWMMVAGKWRKYKAWRGGVQGSYVIKVVFDGVITTAIRAVTATTNNWHKKAANGQAQGAGRNGRVATVGIADDWYMCGRASRVLETFRLLERYLH